ncbi:hypothetical protein ALC56_07382 [Trachymyrmex septentrionalis]|uniref:Uncharacterized protein n=1 Tax=Trachymyrmex septentrionalis TaxID=34720 RepID=A0A195FDR3_9HYME|nr:hypothetical protein ALC56_07382 [Trachymyrmex septentrionalis]
MPSARVAHRKLSDYCGIFAEKTNRIGRNVESFMQSRGLLPIRRSVDETPRRDALGINGDVIRNDDPPSRIDRETSENRRHRYETLDYERPRRNGGQKKRVAYSNHSAYPRDPMRADASYVRRFNATEPRRVGNRREYAETDYDATDTWRRDLDLARGGLYVFKPILRNGINHGGDERPYYSTLPRRSRTINFKDQARDSPEGERRRTYPKSLQDLTDLELDDVTCLPTARGGNDTRGERLDDNYRRRNRYRRGEGVSPFDDDYLKLCRSLSRLDKYPRGSRYGPGQVHYERECRTFGKDTVAFIYYKTCYL